MVAGTEDYFTPQSQNKSSLYLAHDPDKVPGFNMVALTSHFWRSRNVAILRVSGPDPALARPSMDALSTAFFKTHLANQPGTVLT